MSKRSKSNSKRKLSDDETQSDWRDELLKGNEITYRNENPLQLQHPFRLIVVGKTDTGKTFTVLKHIILDPQSPFDKVIWCAPAKSLEQTKLQNVAKHMKGKLVLMEGIDEDLLSEMIANKKQKDQWLIVFDDLLNKIDTPFIKDLFTSGRHSNISTAEILQRAFAGKEGRTHRLNSEYMLLCSFSDESEIERLMRGLAERGVTRTEELMDCYHHSTRQQDGKGWMLIDTKAPPAHHILRYRDNDLNQVWIKDE